MTPESCIDQTFVRALENGFGLRQGWRRAASRQSAGTRSSNAMPFPPSRRRRGPKG